jgi:choline-glycine betaine transporter
MNIYATKTTASTYTRVKRGTPGAVRLPVWSTTGKHRAPRIGETFDTFNDVTTVYAVAYR